VDAAEQRDETEGRDGDQERGVQLRMNNARMEFYFRQIASH
jgi:hypothetical protein